MARSLVALSMLFAASLAGCSASDDGSPTPYEAPDLEVACSTSLPDAEALSGPMVLGFVSDGPSQLIVMDAEVEVDADGRALSITIDGPERCGPAQHFDDIPLSRSGTFSLTNAALKFPHGATAQDDAEAVVSFSGGFCTSAGSLQGTYAGKAMTPEEKDVDGAWFISRVTDPAELRPTCAASAE